MMPEISTGDQEANSLPVLSDDEVQQVIIGHFPGLADFLTHCPEEPTDQDTLRRSLVELYALEAILYHTRLEEVGVTMETGTYLGKTANLLLRAAGDICTMPEADLMGMIPDSENWEEDILSCARRVRVPSRQARKASVGTEDELGAAVPSETD